MVKNLTNIELKIISDEIAGITDKLFMNNIQDMLNSVISVIEKVRLIGEGLNNDEQLIVYEIIQYIMVAMENKDYLLISDILTYEMLPIINKLSIRGEMDDSI